MLRTLVILSLFYCVSLFSQEKWRSYFDVLQAYDTRDEIKMNVSAGLAEYLQQLLKLEDDLAIDPDIPLHKVATEDGYLQIYTWHYTFQDASSNYGGVLVFHHHVFPLNYVMSPISSSEEYDALSWGGGIYYDVIPQVAEGDTLYTLLAWDGNNGVSYKKIIEVLSFDRKGKPFFGQAVFDHLGRREKRVIFEYSAEMSLLLQYDKELQCIVTNALYANDQRFAGVDEYYSATDAFNVFRFENGLWVLYKNVDLRMDKRESLHYQNADSKVSSGL